MRTINIHGVPVPVSEVCRLAGARLRYHATLPARKGAAVVARMRELLRSLGCR